MEKKKMALCTPIPEGKLDVIREFCDITICGELKHGKGNAPEAQTREECMGHELIVLGDEKAGAETIKAWAAAGMKFMGVAKGTPTTVDYAAIDETGIQLSYTPGRNRVAVAEFTIGLMIAAARRLVALALRRGASFGSMASLARRFTATAVPQSSVSFSRSLRMRRSVSSGLSRVVPE